MKKLFRLSRFEDLALLILRVSTGGFLLYQCHDNVLNPDRMTEFAKFMEQFGFWQPSILAPFAIFWQMAAGFGFIAGFYVRALGLVTALQFTVAVVMVHLNDPANILWSAAVLIVIGLYLATRGSGRFGFDYRLERKLAPSS
ncbi:DoxX family protein [Qipengyuania qiaonensis]|uniref:DoxX family protein n=1 Tax=Qipengyuania qiaonensis TaxID=2867240 RepID=A0ABS7J9N7_9SPHN|nr:DoxX family protein [Qipengyuania qiaonensis]MBX7484031.1 DoxX family protein [Qipengyuania qiaonensis]